MITDEVYVEIELLRKHGLSLRKIAAEVGCAVNTVRSHLETDTLPRYQRNKLRVTKLSPFEAYLRERQAAAHPAWIPATVLQREIAAQGYVGGLSQLRAFLRGLKPVYDIDCRLETDAVAVHAGMIRQGYAQMGLAQARRPQENHVGMPSDEVQAEEMADQVPVDFRRMVPLELLKSLY